MKPDQQTEYIVQCIRESGSMYEDDARGFLAEHDAHVRAETLAEVTAWLVKKAREFHASSRKSERQQGDTAAILASKIARGAVHPNNLRTLPDAGFFEHGRTYEREGRTFQCLAIDAFPLSGEPRAIGWYATSSGGWPSIEALDPDDWTHGRWTDVDEGGEGQ